MKTIRNNIINEIVINKSRFICLLIKVDDISLIESNLNKIKDEYKDATHYCYSYIIGNIKRFSDNGEPNGTAGLPILNVLENNNLNNILCVVVRYFGGIKLGANGLIRAYTNAVSECLNKVSLNNILDGKKLSIYFNYDKSKYFDNLLKDINIINKTFDEVIKYEFYLTNDEYDSLIENINNNIINIEIIDNIKMEKEA